ncbi:sialidase family protein [Gimesia panareensis]|uniref:sialidase family protein n=1 Tax=Gimesia panareensis TaxID=2527978 RepID=UPI00118A3983|nr:sialidase family protein [Gimesia panareensis]QDU49181.1 BNR/Asp-box repeat protein [Gimesia panareensis]
MQLNQLETGVLFRNSMPHVKSVHAYFPSVAVLSDGSLLGLFSLGEAFEAVNLQLHWSRSIDQGQTWHYQGQLNPATPDRLTSTFGRVTTTPDWELLANLIRYDRSAHPDEGLSNPDTLGLVPAELLLMRSGDRGKTWNEPEAVTPPLVGPAFEMCSPITVLRDGRWLWPTSTWRGWDGELPNGNRMLALVSHDQGQSWNESLDIMHSPDDHLIFWESKVLELPDGRLLAVAWCYDEAAGTDRPNHFSFSTDGGASWSTHASTGLSGQTLTPHILDDGSLLCVYRRLDEPGLWACHARLNEHGQWENQDQLPLWGTHSSAGTTRTGENMSENFAALKFGAPHIVRLSDGQLFVSFWCYEQNVSLIRWFKFTVS